MDWSSTVVDPSHVGAFQNTNLKNVSKFKSPPKQKKEEKKGLVSNFYLDNVKHMAEC